MADSSDAVLREQIEYYRARAGEYDEWFLRRGRFDHGPEANAVWFAEVQTVQQALAVFAPTGQVLELAAGTGLWTQQLLRSASSVMAVDASPETLALNRQRVGQAPVTYVVADLFTWQPPARFDCVFFGFWLSHVPPEQFATFWQLVRSALKPGGRVFFVDSRYAVQGTARDHVLRDEDATTLTRRLNDGREFQIVKVFYRPEQLAERLQTLGWRVQIDVTPNYFIYGTAEPNA